MPYQMIQLEVADFDHWKSVFYELDAERQRLGQTSLQLFRVADNPRGVMVLQGWKSLEGSRTFYQSEAFRDAAKRAGNLSAPSITVLEHVEEGAAQDVAGAPEAMDALRAYFAAFDGNASWATVAPLFETAMHDELVLVAADGEKTKGQWAEAVKGLLDKGAVIDEVGTTAIEGDSFHYRLTLKVGDKTMSPASKATVRDGKLVRIEPVDAAVYTRLAASP